MLTTIPFAGFYQTVHSDAIEREVARIAEHYAESSSPSQLDPVEVFKLFDQHTNYRHSYEAYAKSYTEHFSTFFTEETGIRAEFTFKILDSPKEYNFSTDVIRAEVLFQDMQAMMNCAAAENFSHLNQVMQDRFTSRPGFLSFYSPDVSDHLDTPLSHWDENQVQCLIDAALRQAGVEEYEVDLAVAEQIDVFRVVEDAVDWRRVEAGLAEMSEAAEQTTE